MSKQHQRLHVVDALRGFALAAIMLVHNIEHFDFYHKPAGLPEWLQKLDGTVWDTVFFLFGGKAYAIFALLFGLTFSIQLERRASQGLDFRGRFAWRLLLLFGFSLANCMFYQGDILMQYSVLGIVLIAAARLSNWAVAGLALVLLLQPSDLWKIGALLLHPQPYQQPLSWFYFGKANEYLAGDSVLHTWVGNLTNGRHAVLLWFWEFGRIFQTPGLFLLGMLAGRRAVFGDRPGATKFWGLVLGSALSAFGFMQYLRYLAGAKIADAALKAQIDNLLSLWANLGLTFSMVAAFILLFRLRAGARVLGVLAPLGRMSLSNYLFQSLLGTTLYYGYGFGLYRYTGATHCLLIGIALATLQVALSAWWLRHHKQGPLETLWHRATWIEWRGRSSRIATKTAAERLPAEEPRS